MSEAVRADQYMAIFDMETEGVHPFPTTIEKFRKRKLLIRVRGNEDAIADSKAPPPAQITLRDDIGPDDKIMIAHQQFGHNFVTSPFKN